MGKIKLVDILLSAISALASAAKSVIKFIGYISKVKKRPATSTA